MKWAFALFGALAATSAAAGEAEPTIDDVCLRVAELQFRTEGLERSNVQSFPELEPPRVRMTVGRKNVEKKRQADRLATLLDSDPTRTTKSASSGSDEREQRHRSYGEVMCEFERASPPFGLSMFDCAGMACFITQKRLEELQVLIRREGF